MSKYTVDMKEYIRNGIEEEIQMLISNGDIRFSDDCKKEEFIADLLSTMLEQFENDMAYYGKYNPNFTDSVSDAIAWDGKYYGIEERSE